MYMKQVVPICASLMVIAVGEILLSQMVQGQTHKAPAAHPAASLQKPGATPGAVSDTSYVIGEDDVLAINVWNEPDLRQSLPVRPDGKISLPLIGDIQAAGRTPMQLEDDIATKLHSYITHPNVSVIVQEIKSKKFNILGRVMKPGAYSLSSATTVLDAIAQAGGFQDFAKEKNIYILRESPGGTDRRFRFNYKEVITGKNIGQNIELEPNDTIVVP
jgi:polysaccharide export outer membrane protein